MLKSVGEENPSPPPSPEYRRGSRVTTANEELATSN